MKIILILLIASGCCLIREQNYYIQEEDQVQEDVKINEQYDYYNDSHKEQG